MRRLLQITLGTFLVVALAVAFGSPVRAQEQRREFDFNRIGKLLRSELTPQARARLGITYLREEIAHPTSTYEGSGGPIFHEYVLAQLIGATAGRPDSQETVDRDLLWRELQASAPGEYRDMLILTLGLAGDLRVSDHVAAYLRNVKNADVLRASAAKALGELADTRHIGLLTQVMQRDPQFRSKITIDQFERPINEHTFRVRVAARAALRRLDAKGISLDETVRQAMKTAILKTSVPASTKR